MKRYYHTFRRIMPDGTKFEVKALVKHPRRKVEIEVEEGDLVEAIRRDGFADGQNCAGAVCVCRPKHKKLFDHEVSALVDWWHSRVFLSAGRQRNGVAIATAMLTTTQSRRSLMAVDLRCKNCSDGFERVGQLRLRYTQSRGEKIRAPERPIARAGPVALAARNANLERETSCDFGTT